MTGWSPWRPATQEALYGERGFYRRPGGPAAHFRTSAHASPLFASALLRVARSAGLATVVDLGSGGGELLAALRGLAPDLRLLGVDVAGRPQGLPSSVAWAPALPDRLDGALVVANEWLDNLPVDVVQLAPDGLRTVEVDVTSGAERLGPAPSDADAAWLRRWWPLTVVGDRAEVGRPRDDGWADVVRRLRRGLAVAVDYDHRLGSRPPRGTLTGYARGRQVPPVPDGSCDITSHVALDACAAAGAGAGADWTLLTTQRTALAALGVTAALPDRSVASGDPAGYLRALARAGQAGELLARGGLGGFGWLLQGVGVGVPPDVDGIGEPRPSRDREGIRHR